MNVMNCRSCGRLFNQLSRERICPDCAEKLEEKFQRLKLYLEEKPSAPLETIAKDNDVSVKQIKEWVREERLTFAEGSIVGIECERCGTMIRTGRYCDACRANMANTLMSAMDKPKPEKAERNLQRTDKHDKMRFL